MAFLGGEYEFTNSWFEDHRRIWDDLIQSLLPSKILEVGSFEGRSTCYLIDTLASQEPLLVHCVDTWQGGVEHQSGGQMESDMSAVEVRFRRNIELAISRSPCSVNLIVDKARSSVALAKLIVDGNSDFDLIYVDGSHNATDVLMDALMCFQLLRVGGVMVFDDYIWHEGLPVEVDPLRCPKIAIDAFTTIFARKLRLIPATSIRQIYIEKLCH